MTFLEAKPLAMLFFPTLVCPSAACGRLESQVTLFDNLGEFSCFHFQFGHPTLLLACEVEVLLGLCLEEIDFVCMDMVNFRSVRVDMVFLRCLPVFVMAQDFLTSFNELLHLLILRQPIEFDTLSAVRLKNLIWNST